MKSVRIHREGYKCEILETLMSLKKRIVRKSKQDQKRETPHVLSLKDTWKGLSAWLVLRVMVLYKEDNEGVHFL